ARMRARVMWVVVVIVRDVAGRARFLHVTRFGFLVGAAFFSQDFHGHGAADDGVESFIDAGHSAAQEFLQLVFADARGKLHGLSALLRPRRKATRGSRAGRAADSSPVPRPP